jgi:hypothetical protein
MSQDENEGWIDAAHKQPALDKFVLALWMPPHCSPQERVLVWARRRKSNWEVVIGRICAGLQQCFNRTVPASEINWWRELRAPQGIELSTGR